MWDELQDDLKNRFSNQYGRDSTFENVLDELGKSGYERRDLLIRFFRNLTPSEGYKYIAALLKAGYFYPIVIALNFDTLLENAFEDDDIVSNTKKIKSLVQEDVNGGLKVSNSGGIKLSTCQSLGLKTRGHVDDRCGGVPHVARFIQQRIEHQRDRQKNRTQPWNS